MTLPTSPGPQSGAVRANPDRGQIPFRLRIGVTGDPDLPHDPVLAREVSVQLSQLIEQLQAEEPDLVARLTSWPVKAKPTVVELAVISQLASGADRLAVREILGFASQHGQRARLEVVLPAHRRAHAEAQQWDIATRNEFFQHLGQASMVTELGGDGLAHDRHVAAHDQGGRALEHGPAHAEATRRLLASCDILLVLWDGKNPGGPGRTAETLLEAASLSKPCVWISTDPPHPVMTNFGRGHSAGFYLDVSERVSPGRSAQNPGPPDRDVLSPLRESLQLLDRYNGERLGAKFDRRLGDEFDYPRGQERWIAPYFLRATMLARHYQTLFTRSAQLITALAILAAAFLGVHLTLNSSPIWDWAEVGSLALITVVFLVLNRLEFHDRWISYRVLAERLRSARFLVPAGVDFPIFQRTVTAYIERHPSDWIQRTFDEFWQSERERRQDDRSEHHGETVKRQPGQDEALAQRLADGWIGAQVAYHRKRHQEHQLWQRLLLVTILVLFAAAVVCAVLDASAVDRELTGFLSVLFPAAAASLGALLTVRQHRQLAERSDQVSQDLQEAQRQIKNADSRRVVVSAAARAARIMAEENEDWLGALWFLDVEHPG